MKVEDGPKLAVSKDRRFFAELLLELERRLDVNAVRAGGIHLWPLIRWELARGIKAIEKDKSIAAVDKMRSAGFAGGPEERAEVQARSRAQERKAYANPNRQIAEQLRQLRELGRRDFLVFTKIEKYYQPIGDAFYAPVLDPIYEELGAHGSVAAVALGPLDIACVNQPLSLSIDPYMRISSKMQKQNLPDEVRLWVLKLNALLDEIAPDYQLDFDRVTNRLNRYRRRTPFFRDVFEILKPRMVFCSSFTGWAPMIWAAREAGVKTVDVQHGGQSPFHYITTHWTDVPPEGYELLPDFFWLWGEPIRSYIDPWLPGGASRHLPVVGGNRYVAKWKRGACTNAEDDELRALLQRMDDAKRVVLVTLGYSVEEIVPECISDAIRSTPEWLWLIRLHPINRGQNATNEILRKFDPHEYVNIEYESSTRLPLYELMSRVDSHVTTFSTACREASAFDVPNVITHPIGQTYFSTEIERGEYSYADSGTEIVHCIERAENGQMKLLAQAKPYIETDDAVAEAALKFMIAQS